MSPGEHNPLCPGWAMGLLHPLSGQRLIKETHKGRNWWQRKGDDDQVPFLVPQMITEPYSQPHLFFHHRSRRLLRPQLGVPRLADAEEPQREEQEGRAALCGTWPATQPPLDPWGWMGITLASSRGAGDKLRPCCRCLAEARDDPPALRRGAASC